MQYAHENRQTTIDTGRMLLHITRTIKNMYGFCCFLPKTRQFEIKSRGVFALVKHNGVLVILLFIYLYYNIIIFNNFNIIYIHIWYIPLFLFIIIIIFFFIVYTIYKPSLKAFK